MSKKEAKKLQVLGKFGAVKTVNGVSPDENGNVEVDAFPDDSEQLALLVETDMLPAVHTNGAILTDENGNVILRH